MSELPHVAPDQQFLVPPQLATQWEERPGESQAGKVDKKRLREPVRRTDDPFGAGQSYVMPETAR
ncbi:hypothetical protein [Streptomyces sp. NBC_00038]|uniref:hypothetical protein n=1 Tax=Streptomyces sp. NBC_00038 TaxID=2903615 RepID=UPI00225209D9|nr:hypothetical protein [Streptomyces sp. NBC_00038]MCX5561162.1 hypothetical protein [Streptomyces sp. NBC_00038]